MEMVVWSGENWVSGALASLKTEPQERQKASFLRLLRIYDEKI
jgi:hypothetical protein